MSCSNAPTSSRSGRSHLAGVLGGVRRGLEQVPVDGEAVDGVVLGAAAHGVPLRDQRAEQAGQVERFEHGDRRGTGAEQRDEVLAEFAGHGSGTAAAAAASRSRVGAAMGRPLSAAARAARSTRPGSLAGARRGRASPRRPARRRRGPVPRAPARARRTAGCRSDASRRRTQPPERGVQVVRDRARRLVDRAQHLVAARAAGRVVQAEGDRDARRVPAAAARRPTRPANRCSSPRTSSRSAAQARVCAGRSTSCARASACSSRTSRRPPRESFRFGSSRKAPSPASCQRRAGLLAQLVEPLGRRRPPQRRAPRARTVLGEPFVAGEVAQVEQAEQGLHVLARDADRLVRRADGVVQADPAVPDRVPDRVRELGDTAGAVVQQHQVEIRARRRFAPAEAARPRRARPARRRPVAARASQPS